MSRKRFKGFSSWYYEKDGLYGYVCNFSVDYDVIAVNDILGSHKYVMKNNNIWVKQ